MTACGWCAEPVEAHTKIAAKQCLAAMTRLLDRLIFDSELDVDEEFAWQPTMDITGPTYRRAFTQEATP